MNRVHFVLFALLAVLALPSTSFAKKHKLMKEKMVAPQTEFSELNLTKEQQEKISKIRSESREKRQALQQEMQGLKSEMQKAMESNADDAALKAIFDKKQAVKKQMAEQRFNTMLGIRAELTPEQRKKFRGMMDEKREHHKGMKMHKMDDASSEHEESAE